MKSIRYIYSIFFAAVAALVSASCNSGGNTGTERDNTLQLTISTRAVSDALSKGNDDKFSSIALYVFNEEDDYCEYSEVKTGMDNEDIMTRSINVSNKTKLIYAIANFDDIEKRFSGTITENTSRQELDDLSVGTFIFDSDKILMVGRKRVLIASSYVSAEVPMQRLAARVDFYLSKSEGSAADDITVDAITMYNMVANSDCQYGSSDMMPTVLRTLMTSDVSGTVVEPAPSDPGYLTPENAVTSFYSYQYTATASDPNRAFTPYIEIRLQVNSIAYSYVGYLTDGAQVSNKYGLTRNTVYRVIAQFSSPDNKLFVEVEPVPWTLAESEVGYEVTDDDYSFDVFNAADQNSVNGIVQYPYTPAGGKPTNASSYVDYKFSLTAPAGAVWTATITNGLEFGFGSEGSVAGTTAVSKGIAGQDPFEIRVKATKPWIGVSRSTYLYITVNGEKLKINPVLAGGTRKFPGDNDTDIFIRQTEYK